MERIFEWIPSFIDSILQAFNRWGYYPLILIGSWAFATINRLYDFANPGHKIFWLSFLDIGFAGLMVSFLMLLYSVLDVTELPRCELGKVLFVIINLLGTSFLCGFEFFLLPPG